MFWNLSCNVAHRSSPRWPQFSWVQEGLCPGRAGDQVQGSGPGAAALLPPGTLVRVLPGNVGSSVRGASGPRCSPRTALVTMILTCLWNE